MLASVNLKNFKSFRDATLPFAQLTLLIGPNASGKSNAIEALQFLSWMANGRRLSDIEGAIRERDLALRGGVTDLCRYPGEDRCFEFAVTIADAPRLAWQIRLQSQDEGLRITSESLSSDDTRLHLYSVVQPASDFGYEMQVEYNNFARGGIKPQIACVDQQPVFTQLTTPARFAAGHERSQKEIPRAARRLQESLDKILFLDPVPARMRGYSHRIERRLRGDGANLSAVLHHLTEDLEKKVEILDFVRHLPEQSIDDVTYHVTPRGEVMVRLQETFGGEQTHRDAAVLSDGTLRVLSIAAALWSVAEGSTVVIEEIDNGVHPSRAERLLSAIRQVAGQRQLRVLITTHNPALQDAVPDSALPNVLYCYRDPATGESRITRLEEIPGYPELAARGSLGDLVTSGTIDRHVKARASEDEIRAQRLEWLQRFSAAQ